MGNIITKDPDTIHWESNKNNSNQLTNDAKTLLGLLPDKLDASSEKPAPLEPVKVLALDPKGSKYNGLSDTTSIIHSIQSPSKPIDVITSTEIPGPIINKKIPEQFVQSISNPKQIGGNRILDTAELSDTSPFISSDMYNNLIQTGGAKLTKGGAHLRNAEDDSSTSSTSSSDDETDKNKKKNKKTKSDETTDSVEVTEDSNNSNLSYVSSSAHTGGGSSSESETHNDSNNSNDSNKSTEESHEVHESSEKHESPEKHESSEKHESPEKHESEVMGYSANSPEPNEATPVSSPKKSKKKNAKKSKDDSSSSSSSSSPSPLSENSVESIPKVSVEDSIENKNSNLPPSEINTSAIEMVSAS